MSRAARRRAEREAKKAEKAGPAPLTGPTHITLKNPVTEHFPAFIVGNAQYCDHVVEAGTAEGQRLVLCGAGPSLVEEIDAYAEGADQIWGCNSALVWLHDNGYPVTHGFTVDQTPAMVNEWKSAPDVEYLVASTVHPHLVEHLLNQDRTLRFFHNFVGIQHAPVEWCECGHDKPFHEAGPCSECECEAYDPKVASFEDWLYMSLYPATIRAGSGLNAVTRAIDIAINMGFAEIDVLGADCAIRLKSPMPNVPQGSPAHLRWLRESTVMHADGGHALSSGASALTLGGIIDGRHWESKPDLLVSAVWLVKMARKHEGRIKLVGDTLPNALQNAKRVTRVDTDTNQFADEVEVDALDDFIYRLPTMVGMDGQPLEIG